VSQVKAVRTLTGICYTGFTLEALRETGAQDVIDFLESIDVLIDGPYRPRIRLMSDMDAKKWLLDLGFVQILRKQLPGAIKKA